MLVALYDIAKFSTNQSAENYSLHNKNMRGRFVHHLNLSQPGTTLATDWLLKLVLCPSKIIFLDIIEMLPTPVLYFASVAFTTIRVFHGIGTFY